MPIFNTQEAKSRRPPGRLPNITRRLADTEAALKRLPDSLRASLAPIITPLVELSKEQSRLNMDLWLRFDALPGKHASTHTGGSDTVASLNDPTAIALANVASPGTAHHALSYDDHVHPVGDDIADVIESLDGIDVDPIDGAAVTDATLRRLFMAILMQLLELEQLLLRRSETESQVKSIALPIRPYSLTATDATLLADTTPERTGAVIYNGSGVVLYVKYGLACSITDYSVQVSGTSGYELPLAGYVGPITGILASGTGTVQVTETVTYGN